LKITRSMSPAHQPRPDVCDPEREQLLVGVLLLTPLFKNLPEAVANRIRPTLLLVLAAPPPADRPLLPDPVCPLFPDDELTAGCPAAASPCAKLRVTRRRSSNSEPWPFL
jgi:hypothetical protein